MLGRLLCSMMLAQSSAMQIGATASRRAFLSQLAAAGTAASIPSLSAHAISARTGLSSPFTGEYDAPNHPGCLRSVKVVGAKLDASGRKGPPLAYVKGVDGLPAASKTCPKGQKPGLTDVWSFNGKPGILFPDGNKWVKVNGGTPDRRPPNETLK